MNKGRTRTVGQKKLLNDGARSGKQRSSALQPRRLLNLNERPLRDIPTMPEIRLSLSEIGRQMDKGTVNLYCGKRSSVCARD